MSVIEENIKSVNKKIQQLLKQYQLLQKENERLKMQVADLNIARQKDAAQNEQLRQQVSILKTAAGTMNEADKKAFDKQIGKYIKEIDKCIAMLSE
jgi:FtsZ-binding cell division protein ZapB